MIAEKKDAHTLACIFSQILEKLSWITSTKIIQIIVQILLLKMQIDDWGKYLTKKMWKNVRTISAA